MRKVIVPALVVALVSMLAMSGVVRAGELEVGDKAPDFKAKGVDGKTYSLKDFKDAKVVVVCFTCNKCPVAVDYEDRFIGFAKKYKKKPVAFVALNVNHNEDLKAMKERAEAKDFNFPYAYDASGDAARAYGATNTPHLFVLDKDRKVAYVGAFDDARDPDSAKKNYVNSAVDALLAGKKPETQSTPAVGCSIKLAKKN